MWPLGLTTAKVIRISVYMHAGIKEIKTTLTNNIMTKQRLERSISVIKRIAVMGAANTGKSSLISRFLGQPFEEIYSPTVEDHHIGNFYCGETLYHMEITDTSGSFEFPAMERLTMEKAGAFIFVYSLEDELSFEKVKMCLKRLKEVKDISTVPIIVVCNKADLANIDALWSMQMQLDNGKVPEQCFVNLSDTCSTRKTVTKEEILCKQLVQVRELGCEFLLTSAKFRWNVNRIFQQLFSERTRARDEKSKKTTGSPKTPTFKFKIKRRKDYSRAQTI
ncbi:GTP-binding protein Di-Ras2-like [Dendronephthya gigantea]|uniref:GTP-binding protein Di-Ras2-like n=1 Tax=Dendronephthya gigantea TaxID=151771 RepID=UPI0010698FD4|nr:GTP-binding protein Di-Ras2-like [Dendronephthya gigantea]